VSLIFCGRLSLFKESIACSLAKQKDARSDSHSCVAVAWAVEKAVAVAMAVAVEMAVAVAMQLTPSIRLILENYVADVLLRFVKQFLDSLYLGVVEVAIV
jgi:hypothetical protein